MPKKNKKRTKRYSGEDAKQLQPPTTGTQPIVHRYEAVDRGTFGQWWFEKKKMIRIIVTVVLVVAIIVWLLVELFRIVF